MAVTNVFEAARPSWPGKARDDSWLTSLSRSIWLVLATAYASIGIGGAYLVRQSLAPVQWVLRWLVEERHLVRGSKWPWIASGAVSAGGLVMAGASGSVPSVFRELGTVGGTALFIVSGYLLLGAFRWSSLWLMARENEYESYDAMLSRLDCGVTGWFIARLRQPSDVIWLRHVAVSTVVHLPPTFALVMWGHSSWFARCWYAVAILATIKTAALNHNVGHHRPFRFLGRSRSERAIGRGVSLWYHYVIEIVEGDVPNLTITGHNLIHHVENNGPDDFESTYPYDRTSFVSTALLYFNCMLSYSFGRGVLSYLWRRRERPYREGLRSTVVGLVYTYGLLLLVAAVAGVSTMLFLLAIRLLQSGLRYGPFAYLSHPFVDPDDPRDSFSNSLDFAARGTLTHGGGVHILHHRRPGHHWSGLKAERRDRELDYTRHDAIVFPFELAPLVQPLLFGKRFDVLARWTMTPAEVARYESDQQAKPWVPVAPPDDGLARMLETRARPASWEPPGRLVSAVDAVAARAMLWAAGAEGLTRAGEIES